MGSSSESDVSESTPPLPLDTALTRRKEAFEKLLKDYSQVDGENELSASELSEEFRGDGAEDWCSAPEARVDNTRTVALDGKREKTLQAAVRAREGEWKHKGIKFTFEKVDEWLRQSQSSIHKEMANGDKITENKQSFERHYARIANFDNPQALRPADLGKKFLEDRNDHDDDSSVDTAKYILANRNKGTTSTVRTRVIRKVITQTVEVQEIEETPRETPTSQCISSARKRRRRRTRGELNKLHDSRVIVVDDSDSDDVKPVMNKVAQSSSESESPPKRPKLLQIKGKTPFSETETSESAEESNKENQSVYSAITASSQSKSFAIYTPDGETRGKFLLTNQHFVTALGENLAHQVLKDTKIDTEIDASSQVVLEMPSTDPDDSEEDFCVKIGRRPRISVITAGASVS